MCGFAGFLEAPRNADAAAWPDRLERMGKAIRHRGPDGAGVWIDGEHGIGLVHRRLAIIDLSPAGHQPMVSASGRYVLVFNGEIYNHLAIRAGLNYSRRARRLHGAAIRDTETLLEPLQPGAWSSALRTTVGMFALALWDRETRL